MGAVPQRHTELPQVLQVLLARLVLQAQLVLLLQLVQLVCYALLTLEAVCVFLLPPGARAGASLVHE